MCERFDYRSVSGAAEQVRSYGAHVDREPHLPGMASQLLTTGGGAVAPDLEPPGSYGRMACEAAFRETLIPVRAFSVVAA